ncbi:MAG: hypothetical protein IPG07_03305 [Crocinitomicaceae bacterium]|nr:hypothetical protein [Crocinitomicaceae bacterium]
MEYASRRIGTNGDNAPQSLAFDSHGNLFCGGWYDMFGTWGATTIEADNGYDAYIAKIFPPLEPSIAGDTLICLGDTVIFPETGSVIHLLIIGSQIQEQLFQAIRTR